MDERQIDSLIEAIDVHCCSRGVTIDEFVDRIQNVSSLSDDLGIPLDQLPQYVAREKEELENQIREVRKMKTKRRKLLQSVDVTLAVLDDYDKNKDKLQNYEAIEIQVNDLQQQLNYYKSPEKIFLDVSKEQLKNMNTFLVNSITEDDLVKMLHYLCHNPFKNMDIIHTLQREALGKSNDMFDDDEHSGITDQY